MHLHFHLFLVMNVQEQFLKLEKMLKDLLLEIVLYVFVISVHTLNLFVSVKRDVSVFQIQLVMKLQLLFQFNIVLLYIVFLVCRSNELCYRLKFIGFIRNWFCTFIYKSFDSCMCWRCWKCSITSNIIFLC